MRSLKVKGKVIPKEQDRLVKVITNKGGFDWVKKKMLDYWAKKGYIVCLAEEKVN